MENYYESLKKNNCRCLDDIIKMCCSALPQNYQQRPWTHPELNHGANILQSDEALNCYMTSYGEMHENKCRVALQNFPYDLINATLEIVDWGCGQGIGTIAVLEALNNHNLMMLLKRITLIEPSLQALKRAEDNVSYLTGKAVELNVLNKFLPCYDEEKEMIDYVACRHKFVIHVFSNILDVTDIDIAKIAELIYKSEGTHIMLITGPKNSASYRIEQFCGIFNAHDFFSNVNSSRFDLTSTGHPYTCISRGFVYNGEPLNHEIMNKIHPSGDPVYDDYDIQLQLENNVFDKDKGRVAYRLSGILCDNDLMYSDCQINEASVDFIIMRKDCGLLLINVFTEDINKYSFKEELKKVTKKDSQKQASLSESKIVTNYNVLVDGYGNEIQSPVSQIQACHVSIKDGIEELLLSTINSSANFRLIKKAVVFVKNTKDEVNMFFQCVDDNYKKTLHFVALYGNEFIFDSDVSKNLYKDTYLYYRNADFNDTIFRIVRNVISPGWHSSREGILGIKLTPQQEILSKSRKIEQKISGVAGSGKTQVMVTRAVNAQKRTGGDILLLTFNITLANYLRYRMGQLREDFSWNKFKILHYHHLVRLAASKCGLSVSFDSYNVEDFFERKKDCINKFSAIFIDEVQDYDTTWLKILKRYFLEEGGEFVVFGDPKQNVYHRELDKKGNIRIGVIAHEWNNSLKNCKRFTNPLLADLAVKFQKQYFKDIEADDMVTDKPMIPSLNFNIVSYYDYTEGKTCDDVVAKCSEIIKNSREGAENFVILSFTTQYLRMLDYKYRKSTGETTKTSFITKEMFDHLCEICNVTDCNSTPNHKFALNFDALERSRKYKFTTSSKCLKLSTVQSFKGWESPNVILILECETKKGNTTYMPDSPEAIYTGITRAREQLYVINVGCKDYHDFFKQF